MILALSGLKGLKSYSQYNLNNKKLLLEMAWTNFLSLVISQFQAQ